MHERHQQYLAALNRRADDAVKKHGLAGVQAEVVLVLDTSKSMYAMYKANAVAELATRLLALSLEFDDDGVIPAYAFGDTCRHLGDLTVKDFAGWVEREVIRTGNDFQNGCNYAPVIHDVCSYFFPEDWHRPAPQVKVGRIFKKKMIKYPTLSAPRAHPVYALFVTSGDCQDKTATTDAVRRSSRLPIFWQFIGLQSGKGAPTKFEYLKKLDNLGNTHVDNCGFFEVTDTRNDALLFEGLCREFPGYLRLPKVASMLAHEEDGGLTTKGDRGLPVAGAETPSKMMAAIDDGTEDDTPTAKKADVEKLARQRKAAEERAQAKRSDRSRQIEAVGKKGAVQAEPTSNLAAASSRTVQAAKETRPAVKQVVPAEPSAQVAKVPGAAGPAATAKPMAPETLARRERRIRLETQQKPLPEKIEEAQAALAKQAAHTVIRPAVDDDDEVPYVQELKTVTRPAMDEGKKTVTRPAINESKETKESKKTVVVPAADEDDVPYVQELKTVTRPAIDQDSGTVTRAAHAEPARPASRPATRPAPHPLAQVPVDEGKRTVIRPAVDEMPEFRAAQDAHTSMVAALEDEGDTGMTAQDRLEAIRARRAAREAQATPPPPPRPHPAPRTR